MNAPIKIAQTTLPQGDTPVQTIKLIKPESGQAITVKTGYDGKVKLDFSAIADERITIVRVGETAVIFFHDNKSTITLDPFFGSDNLPLAFLEFDLGGNRIFTAEQIAGILPFTVYQGILPAAGEGASSNEQAAGANFNSSNVEALPPIVLNLLLPPESLGPIDFQAGTGAGILFAPLSFGGLDGGIVGIVEEEHLANGVDSPFGHPILSDGNEDGIGQPGEDADADPDFDNTTHQFSGQLVITGGSGAYTFTMVPGWTPANPIFSQGDALSYVIAGNVLTGYVNGGGQGGSDRVVFTLEVSATGVLTFTIYDQIDHPVTGVEDILGIDFSGLVQVDDPIAGLSLVLDGVELGVIDDVPILTSGTENRTIDEDDISTPLSQGTSPYQGNTENNPGPIDPAIITGNLQHLVKFGTDEHPDNTDRPMFRFIVESDLIDYMEGLGLTSKQVAGAALPGIPLTYTVDTTDPTWIVLTAFEPDSPPGGQDTSNIVFELRINQFNGDYEFRLFDELTHALPDGLTGGLDEVLPIDFGQIIEALDYDGDPVSLGSGTFVIDVIDDLPVPAAKLNPLGVVQHDETPGVQPGNFIEFLIDPADSDTNSNAVKALFAHLETNAPVGDDPNVNGDSNGAVTGNGPIGYARSFLPVVLENLLTSQTGADAPADKSFNLIILDADSGLQITDGSPITLELYGNGTADTSDDLIIGRVGGDPLGDFFGQIAFAIDIDDDGFVSLAQYLSLFHPIPGNSHDETVDLDGKIGAVFTITDSDGDTVSTPPIEIGGNVRFDDDGPSINVRDQVSIDERGQLRLELDETIGNDRYNGGEPQDNNGELDDTGKDLPLKIDVSANLTSADAIGVRATSVTGGLGALFNVQIDFGSDGPLPNNQQQNNTAHDFSFDLNGNGQTNLVVTELDGTILEGVSVANRTISLVEVSPGIIEGRIPGPDGVLGSGGDDYVAFRITILNPADFANAQIQIEQFLAIDHDASEPASGGQQNPENPSLFDEQINLLLTGSGNLQLVLTTTVTDGDGDTATDSDSVTLINRNSSIVSFDDDGPIVTGVTQSTGPNLIINGSFEEPIGGLGSPDWEIYHSIVGWTSNGTIPFEVQAGGAGGLASQDGNAHVELDSDTEGNPDNNSVGDINATENTNTTIQQTIAGTVNGQTYELSFWYAPRGGEGANSSGMKVLFEGVEVFDIPSDPNPYPIGVWTKITLQVTVTGANSVLAFQGTGPEDEFGAFLDNVSLQAVTILDDEDTSLNPAAEIQGGPGDDGFGVTATGSINFDPGTDGLKSIVFSGMDGLQAIYVNNAGIGVPQDVQYNWVANPDELGGGTLTGFTTDLPTVFTLVVDHLGNYTFTLVAPLAHSVEDDPSTGAVETSFEDNLVLDFGFVVTDGDGDTASGTLTFNVDDDSPTASNLASQDVAEGATVTGTLPFITGADGATVTHINGTSLNFDPLDDDYSQAIDIGYGLLKVKATGEYSFTADNPTDSPVPLTTASFTVTDGDGDMAIGNIAFQVVDANVPTGGSATATVDDDGLSTGNPSSNVGDIDANIGDLDGPASSEASFRGVLGGSVGDDVPGVFSFANLHLTNGSVGPETVQYTWSIDTLTATITNGSRSGQPLFRVQILDESTGEYRVTLLREVRHTEGPNDENNEFTSLIYTITDADNSTANGTLQITFNDDAPTAIADTDSVTEDGPTAATGNVASGVYSNGTLLTADDANATDGNKDIGGADGFSKVIWQGAVGEEVAGVYGTLRVDLNGNYVYELNNDLAAVQDLDDGETLQDVFTYSFIDSDGDASSATLTITINGVDDIQPLVQSGTFLGLTEEEHLQPAAGTFPITAEGNEDEEDFEGHDTDEDGPGFSANVQNVTSGTFVVTGGDGSYIYTFAAGLDDTNVVKSGGGNLTSGGDPVLYHVLDGDGGASDTLIGYVNTDGTDGYQPGDQVIFSMVIESNGDWTFTLFHQVDHPVQTDTGPISEETIAINFNGVIVVDDEAGNVLPLEGEVRIIDDVPINGKNVAIKTQIALDESDFASDPSGPDDDTTTTSLVAGFDPFGEATQDQSLVFRPGADGLGSTTYSLSDGDGNSIDGFATGLFITGNLAEIILVDNNGVIEGRAGGAGGQLAFAAGVDANGLVTVQQFAPIFHTDNSDVDPLNDNDHDYFESLKASKASGGIGLSVKAVFTDGDGDSIFGTRSVTIRFEDDGPVVETDFGQGESASINEGGATSGSWDVAPGRDGLKSITFGVTGQSPQVVLIAAFGSVVFNDVAGAGSTLTFFDDGTWTYQSAADSIATDASFTFTVTGTDGDDDTHSQSETVNITNIDPVTLSGTFTGTVEEEHLQPETGLFPIVASGNEDVEDAGGFDTDEGGLNTITNVRSGTFVVTGGDGSYVFEFNSAFQDTQVQMTAGGGLTSGGQRVLYHELPSGMLIGYVNEIGGAGYQAGDRVVFSIDVNDGTGQWAFTLYDKIDHLAATSGGPTTEESTEINLNGVFIADDENGQTTSIQGSIRVIDDVPDTITADPMRIVNGADAVGSGALNFYENIGADGGAAINALVFTGTNDSNLTSQLGTVLSGGQQVKLYGFGTDTLTAKTGADADGNGGKAIFTITLNPDGTVEANDQYTVQFFEALDDGSQITLTTLSFTQAGNNRFNTLDGTSNEDLLFSGATRTGSTTFSHESVNTNANSVGVSAAQSVNDNDVVRIDFVSAATVAGPNFAQQTYNYSAHYKVNAFAFNVVQAGAGTDVWIRIYDAPDNDPSGAGSSNAGTHSDALLPGLATQVEISVIEVNGVPLNLSLLHPDGNGGYLITGLNSNDRITVVATDGYERIEIENPANGVVPFQTVPDLAGGDFDVAAFAYSKLDSGAGQPLNLSFNLLATDGDGDTAAGSIAITTLPPSLTLDGTAADEALVGGINNETLIGGIGGDWLTGGGGVDIFKWNAGDLAGGGFDVIADFESGAGGDVMDLSGLLTGVLGNKADAVRFEDVDGGHWLASQGAGSTLADGDLILQVDIGSGWQDVAVIHDTGSNLTGGDDVIKMLLDASQVNATV